MKFLHAMPLHGRLLFFVIAALALTCIISPWFALAADWFAPDGLGLFSERIPFSRIFNRAFMISGVALFILFRGYFIDGQIKQLFAARFALARRDLVTGWGLAIGSMILLTVAMTASDIFTPYFRLSLSRALSRIASATMAGLSVGVIEELFFRGILFMGLYRQGNLVRAYVGANLFYSVLHFVKPGKALFSRWHRTVSGLFSLIGVVSSIPRPGSSFTRNLWLVSHRPRPQLRIDQNWKIISRHRLTRWLGLQFENHARVRRFYP